MKQMVGILICVSLIINILQAVEIARSHERNQALEIRLGIKQQWIDMNDLANAQAQVDLVNCKNALEGKRYLAIKRKK